MHRRLPTGLAWRYSLYTSYLFYLRTCRNYKTILRAVRQGGDLRELVLRNGVTLELLGPALLSLDTFREIWQKRAYTAGFRGLTPQVVVDIGAHVGMFTIQAAKRWPQASILAYEPELANVRVLERNVRRNGLANVTVYNQAVCGHTGVTHLRVKGQADTHSIYDTPHGGDLQQLVPVECVTLHNIVSHTRSYDRFA